MRLYTGHNNNETLKLVEEGRSNELQFIEPYLSQSNEFRINVNYEVLEQIFNNDNTVDWMEELGFYETEEFFISKSIALVNNELIQFRITKDVVLDETTNLTSGVTFYGVNAVIESAEQLILVQETEQLYELLFLTVYAV